MDSGLRDSSMAKSGPGWRAELKLSFEKREERTVLAENSHFGPLRVQKPLYPEGRKVCHAVLLHPPGGIAGGDTLDIRAEVLEGASALVTTPGATKYYRSGGPKARQSLNLKVLDSGSLEYLPQESIIFKGAVASQHLEVELFGNGVYLGQEILCLGRKAAGETFDDGRFSQRSSVYREGKLLWRDAMDFDPSTGILAASSGLGGFNVLGNFVAAHLGASGEWLAKVRETLAGAEGLSGATLFPTVLVVRHLGSSSEKAREIFTKVWETLRPLALERRPQIPRIWST